MKYNLWKNVQIQYVHIEALTCAFMYMHRLRFWLKASQVPNVNSVHTAVTPWYDLKLSNELMWFAIYPYFFRSFMVESGCFRCFLLSSPINHDLTRRFSLGLVLHLFWAPGLYPVKHGCLTLCNPNDFSFHRPTPVATNVSPLTHSPFFLPLLTSHFLSMQINGLATVTCHLCCFGNHLS